MSAEEGDDLNRRQYNSCTVYKTGTAAFGIGYLNLPSTNLPMFTFSHTREYYNIDDG